jgi:hypothetical protein
MDCEGILGGEVPSKSHCQLLFRICGMHGGRTPVCPCQFERRPSLHDRDSFAELVKNEFKWNTNRTPLCLNEGNNYIYIHILYSHMYHHVSTVTLPWNPPANDSCPESSREHPLLYWPRAQHHRPQFLQGCAPQDDDWLHGPPFLFVLVGELFWRKWT